MTTERTKKILLLGVVGQMILWLEYLNVEYSDDRTEINALIKKARRMIDEF